MKYVAHMSDDDLEKLMDNVFGKRIANMEKWLAYLTEKRDNEFLKVEDVCKILHVTDRTIRNWVKKKKLRCHWIGDRQFFLMKDIHAAMTTNF
jgi:excisionase family DNA binding protein